VAAAAAQIGPVDVLVPNAGVLRDAGDPPSRVPLATVQETFDVNVLGAWRVCQAFVPGMVERGFGRVVLISSGTGCFSNGLAPRIPAYSLSKASLNALTVLLAGELAGTGVLVNAVNPGTIRTAMMPGGAREPADAAVDIADAVDLPDSGPTGRLLRSGAPVDW
jgi:NAD(P)-dependent dehydrogenase (short-subunit alcohol dehydrogenase family)